MHYILMVEDVGKDSKSKLLSELSTVVKQEHLFFHK